MTCQSGRIHTNTRRENSPVLGGGTRQMSKEQVKGNFRERRKATDPLKWLAGRLRGRQSCPLTSGWLRGNNVGTLLGQSVRKWGPRLLLTRHSRPARTWKGSVGVTMPGTAPPDQCCSPKPRASAVALCGPGQHCRELDTLEHLPSGSSGATHPCDSGISPHAPTVNLGLLVWF